MAVVTVQLGQCGNQVGNSFFNSVTDDVNSKEGLRSSGVSVNEEYCSTLLNRFFRERKSTWEAHAVLVDMESKVIQQLLSNSSGNWHYPSNTNAYSRGGCGNNWSNGYMKHGPIMAENVLNKLQTVMENCDHVDGLQLIMSAAGGSGSGMGTYMTQIIREELPKKFIINQLIWPYLSGEIVVQWYNMLLTVSHLLSSTDAVVNFQNDNIHEICNQVRNNQHISMQQLNYIISSQVLSLLAPASDSRCNLTNMGDWINHLVSHPAFKLLSLKTVPQTAPDTKEFSSITWNGLLKSLSSRSRKPSCLNDLLILRGPDGVNADSSIFQNEYSPLIPSEARHQIWLQERPLLMDLLSATIVSNDKSITPLLEMTKNKSWQLFASGAYFHHYKSHGLTEEHFLDCFASFSQVIQNYTAL